MKGHLNLKNLLPAFMVLALSLVITLGIGFPGRANATTLDNGSGACSGGGCEVSMPKAVITTGTVQSAMQIVFGVAGVLSVVFIAIGGFKYTVSGGDPSGLTSAKNTIIYALVGLGVSVFAFTIVKFVIGSI